MKQPMTNPDPERKTVMPKATSRRCVRCDNADLDNQTWEIGWTSNDHISPIERYAQEQAAEAQQQRERAEKAEAELAEFDDEYCCPKCASFSVGDIGNEDDFSSMRCYECGHQSEIGEDFPSVRKVRMERDSLRDEIARLLEERTNDDRHP